MPAWRSIPRSVVSWTTGCEREASFHPASFRLGVDDLADPLEVVRRKTT